MKKELYQQILLKFLNLPYKWGGDDPIKGLDCSGFTQEALAILGFDPDGDQTAQGLFNILSKTGPTLISKNDFTTGARCGAIAFYGKDISKITHVAPFLDERHIIEAGGGGSKTNNLEDASNQNAYIRVRPYDRRRDLVAIVYPYGFILD